MIQTLAAKVTSYRPTLEHHTLGPLGALLTSCLDTQLEKVRRHHNQATVVLKGWLQGGSKSALESGCFLCYKGKD